MPSHMSAVEEDEGLKKCDPSVHKVRCVTIINLVNYLALQETLFRPVI